MAVIMSEKYVIVPIYLSKVIYMYVTDVDAYVRYLRTLLTDRVLFTFMLSFFPSNTTSDDVMGECPQ